MVIDPLLARSKSVSLLISLFFYLYFEYKIKLLIENMLKVLLSMPVFERHLNM